ERFQGRFLRHRGARAAHAPLGHRHVGQAATGPRLEQWIPDAVVSDIGLPDEDGYALMPTIRALETRCGRFLPTIALTAYARPQDRARAAASGFTRYIVKPVDADDLLATLAELRGAESPVGLLPADRG